MRLIAVRSSVTGRPLRLSDAEFAMRKRRAANAGSEPTILTTCSIEDFESASTFLMRIAISGNEGRSRRPLESSEAKLCTNPNATCDGDCTRPRYRQVLAKL